MSWSRKKSEERIRKFMQGVPETSVAVRNFSQIESQRRRDLANLRASGMAADEDLIFHVKPSEAVLVNGAHVYVQLIDFDDAMMEQGRETEASHKRALTMLHLHYGICDRVAAEFEAQRVDYHGGRMHAVIVSPSGAQHARDRAQKAIAFGNAIIKAIVEAGKLAANASYQTRVRVGIDSGPSVAVNSGRASEPEPLFLGNAANYAAKLADGDQAGLYASDNIRRDLGEPLCGGGLWMERLLQLNPWGQNPYDLQGAIIARVISEVSPAPFQFHRHTPPLKTIDFKELSASRSIRMPLISLFADIDGFTKYVAECIAGNRVAEMVANLHVLRSEMAATLKEDFNGRKVRFIGDCLHGLVAEGTAAETDEPKTVSRAVEVAGGLRSSFELCQEHLPNIGQIGLAIGIELGATPISRIGIRGDRSVRCSVSKAVSTSETLQRDCKGEDTSLGPRAIAAAPAAVKRLFDEGGRASGLDYSSVASHLTPAPAIIQSGSASSVSMPHCTK
jgi:class 3 adenylate cyclase